MLYSFSFLLKFKFIIVYYDSEWGLKFRTSIPIPFNKEVIPMLNSLCLFQERDPILNMGSGYPVKDLQNNGDGTYRGHLDINNTVIIRKILQSSAV